MADRIDATWAWEPYRPSKDIPWDIKRVGHLFRRAAFGATYGQLQQALKDGADKTIDRLLTGGPRDERFEKSQEDMAAAIVTGNNQQQLRAWWLLSMVNSPHPLVEKLTLFWHNHFATSTAKVQSARFMLGQYRLMRRHAIGSFAEMLQEMSKDPAMMVWLDTRGSKKGNPNENYARELMELFSLGIGNYTEMDIREAARAFTGWDIQGTAVVFNANEHDDGEKTVLGKTGKFKGEDIVRICLDQPACPQFIVTKFFRFMVSETVPATPELIESLAAKFKASGYDFGVVVKTVLRSNLFFSPQVYRTRIKSPVDFGVGVVHALEGRMFTERHTGATQLAVELDKLGQNVFSPPSVKGWDGAQAWLNGQTLLYRQNLALKLTSADQPFNHLDPATLPAKYGKKSDEEILDFYLTLFLQNDVPAATRKALRDFQRKPSSDSIGLSEKDIDKYPTRALAHLVLTQPEFQLD